MSYTLDSVATDHLTVDTTNATSTATNELIFKDHTFYTTETTEPEQDDLDKELNEHFGLTDTEAEIEPISARVTGITLSNPAAACFVIKNDNLPQNFGTASEDYANQWDLDRVKRKMAADTNWGQAVSAYVAAQEKILDNLSKEHKTMLEIDKTKALVIEQDGNTYESTTINGELRMICKDAQKYTIWSTLQWATVLGTCAAVLYQMFA